MSHYNVLIVHREECPHEYLSKHMDTVITWGVEDFDGIFGYDYLCPMREWYGRGKDDFLETVKARDFPKDSQLAHISEIFGPDGDSLWNDSNVSTPPSKEPIEEAFNRIDKDLWCTICVGHL